MPRTRSNLGFTLFEVMVVLIVLGLLGSMVAGGFTNIVPAGREVAAVNKARILNAARVTYALTTPDSATQWSLAASDSDRAKLLIDAGALSGNAADWLTAGGGYTYSLTGALRNKTVLRDKSGSTLNYSD